MLDSPADYFFMSLNEEEISNELNKKQLCFFYLLSLDNIFSSESTSLSCLVATGRVEMGK